MLIRDFSGTWLTNREMIHNYHANCTRLAAPPDLKAVLCRSLICLTNPFSSLEVRAPFLSPLSELFWLRRFPYSLQAAHWLHFPTVLLCSWLPRCLWLKPEPAIHISVSLSFPIWKAGPRVCTSSSESSVKIESDSKKDDQADSHFLHKSLWGSSDHNNIPLGHCIKCVNEATFRPFWKICT